DCFVNALLGFAVSLEVLSRGQQSLHQKCGLHQIAAVIKHAEHQHALSRVPIQEMGPGTMKARRFLEEGHNLRKPLKALFARNKSAIDPDNEGHDAKATRAGRDNAIISWNVFQRRSGYRVSSLPVIA